MHIMIFFFIINHNSNYTNNCDNKGQKNPHNSTSIKSTTFLEKLPLPERLVEFVSSSISLSVISLKLIIRISSSMNKMALC